MGADGLEPGVLVVDEDVLIISHLPGLPPFWDFDGHLKFDVVLLYSFEVVFHDLWFMLVYCYIIFT